MTDMTPRTTTPNPGSQEAADLGCKCPRIDKLESQLDHASREINRFNAELAQLRELIETVTKILQSHTDPAACKADKCGCVGETLEELAEGAREEIASLRADNAVLAKMHGLLADEVRTLRRCTTTQSYESARLAREAKDATNASGALERGEVKAQSAIDAVTDHAAIGEVCLTSQAAREEIAELKRKNGLLAREVMSYRLPPEGERAGTNRRIAIKQARDATDAGGALLGGEE